MNKEQVEVREVMEKKSKINASDINKMNYLKCIIKESLRLHPPFPFLPHEISTSVKVCGYDISPKTRVFVNLWTIQRDTKLREMPKKFSQERFDNNPIDYKGHDHHFIPFRSGRRGCLRIELVIASLEYMMASLLYQLN
ncbi:hypothetical protein SLA2020_212240 [Shorea laevis]